MVSIIVPVYNTGKYIKQCVESVLKQSYTNWELILLNDGSTDDSAQICEGYAKCDSRIRVIHKKNTGVSDTRNRGVEIAGGNHIIFLDSDDYWCDRTFLEKMVKLSERYDLDIVRGEYKAVNDNDEDLFYSAKRKVRYETLLDSAEFLENAIKGEFFLVLSLFKREIFSSIKLNTKQIFLEDMRFYSELLIQPLRCMYIPIVFYAYRKITTSVSSRVNPKKLEDSFSMCHFFNNLSLNVSDDRLKLYFRRYSIMMYYWTLDTMSLDPYFQARDQYIHSFSLGTLQKDILQWKSHYPNSVPVLVFLSPKLGVSMLRLRHIMGAIARKLYLR